MTKEEIIGYLWGQYLGMDPTKVPSQLRKKDVIRQRLYSRWAIKEIIEKVESTPGYALKTIEDYASEMDEYSCKANPIGSYIFSVAHDTAIWLLDGLYAREEKISKGETL